MAYEFTATQVGIETIPDCLVVGVATADESAYVLFQADSGESPLGVHFEMNGQEDGGYDRVRSCQLSRDWLRVSFDNEGEARIALAVSDEAWASLRRGLLDVFGSVAGSPLSVEAAAG